MNKLAVVVSTHNRRELTALCLDALSRCWEDPCEIIVVDDGSTEYDASELSRFCSRVITAPNGSEGCGPTARKRFFCGLTESNADVILTLDNDALARLGYDMWCMDALHCFDDPSGIVIASPYRSTAHEVARWSQYPEYSFVAHMQSIGGISMAVTRSTARKILDADVVWDDRWDFNVCKVASNLIAPRFSYFEHAGRFFGGANSPSADRGVGYWSRSL